MSYGWLTESSLIPKPAKKINVDSSKLVDLQIALLKEKNKPKTAKTFETVKKNKGVELRKAQDQKSLDLATDSKSKMLEKSRLYEKLTENGLNQKDGLVDFQQKKLDSEPTDQRKDFETQRKKFYDEKKKELEEREREIFERKQQHAKGDLYKEIDRSESERIQWEKQAFKEIEEGMTEEMIALNSNRKNVVLQVYDKVLSKNEKEALEKVIIEENEEKVKNCEIKRKRKEILELRKEKLKKLTDMQI